MHMTVSSNKDIVSTNEASCELPKVSMVKTKGIGYGMIQLWFDTILAILQT